MKLRLAVVPSFLFLLLPLTASALVTTDLIAGRNGTVAGVVQLYPDGDDAILEVAPVLEDGWLVRKVQVYFGEDMLPLTRSGNPRVGRFPIKKAYGDQASEYALVVLEGLCSGTGNGGDEFFVAVHADLLRDDSSLIGAWALFENPFTGPRLGWWGTLTRSEICGF